MPVTLPAEARLAVDEIRSLGGEELVREVMGSFVRFADAQLARLHDAAEHGDLETGGMLAHTLRSSARQLGAHHLGEVCASAVAAARGGDAAGFLRWTEEAGAAHADARRWMAPLAGLG